MIVDGVAELLDGAEAAPLAVAVGFEDKYRGLMGDGWFPHWLPGFGQPILVRIARIVAWSKADGALRYRVVT